MLCHAAMESFAESAPAQAAYHASEPFSLSAQGQDLTFYPSGQDRLNAVIETIGTARRSLKLFFYIFATDDCAKRVRDALVEAAARGVQVILIVDDFGSRADDIFLAPLTRAGGIVRRFSAHWNSRYLIRNHQKMLICDEDVAIIGGFNIEQSYFDPPEKNGWNDLAVRPMYEVPVPLLETHLFDFDGDLYGKYLSVELVAYLRPEAKFAGLDALIAQIAADAQKARQILGLTPQSPLLDA